MTLVYFSRLVSARGPLEGAHILAIFAGDYWLLDGLGPLLMRGKNLLRNVGRRSLFICPPISWERGFLGREMRPFGVEEISNLLSRF